MNKYDVLFILDIDLDEATKTALTEKVSSLIGTLGGNVTELDVWGKRAFAYPIDYKTDGYYVKIVFDAPATAPEEINRIMRITDGIVRGMVRRLA